MSKVRYITGTSRGLGRQFAISALERGDRVAATARNVDSLDDLVEKYGDAIVPLALDVTDKSAVGATVARTGAAFGRLDIVVNNAGYGHFGAVEELTEAEIRGQLETNFFGALWVVQAFAPVREAMAARRAGQQPGNPVTAGQAILDVVDADEPPLRVLFGSGPTEMVKFIYAQRLAAWDQWSWVSHKAQGD